ncbi:MAG TPA: thiamine pyrophosphate-dependent enzyme, partial [Candidatus Acidoferrales bacterium]|nr:thiamine pyrophosphate-dependent enzyme [Candidatus Acidoferrales bacterium]
MPTEVEEKERVFDAFRRWGYLQADLDPLGFQPQVRHPELALDGEAAQAARRSYCGTIGADFMHLPEPERRQWIQQRLEAEPATPDQSFILERLIRADLFEQVLQSRYLGSKRFSLEGVTALIPLLDVMLDLAGESGAEYAVLAMSHRGRLNVMLHIAGRQADEIFAGFEDVDPRSVLGSGDVKYHLGATGDYTTSHGRAIHIHLASNPSHLEAVDPVALGRTRAKQKRLGKDGHLRCVPILMHGDAAFAGQGVAAETLAMAGLPGYCVGGTVHVIINNRIGFTTPPEELHPGPFAADLAKRLPIPVLHVNGEDVDAVVRVARLAMEYRYTFASDIVVDMIGYRRHGHSEIDDPTITQPLLYKKIKDHPVLWKIYAQRSGVDATAQADQIRGEYEAAQKKAGTIEKKPTLRTLPEYWSKYVGGDYSPDFEVDTGVPAEELKEIAQGLTRYPDGFQIHPKVKRLLEERARMGAGERPVDYGFAEALALGSLLVAGVPVRLSGQDTRRGTFNQRHSVLVDTESEQEFVPLEHLREGQARCEIHNSLLSEAAVLGFEYGYSRDYP